MSLEVSGDNLVIRVERKIVVGDVFGHKAKNNEGIRVDHIGKRFVIVTNLAGMHEIVYESLREFCDNFRDWDLR